LGKSNEKLYIFPFFTNLKKHKNKKPLCLKMSEFNRNTLTKFVKRPIFSLLISDRRHADGGSAQGTGSDAASGQDEDGGGAARRLPEAHRGAQRVAYRKGGTLKHAPDGRELY
jgi:hypothetical protein